jgi:hypothetical protein
MPCARDYHITFRAQRLARAEAAAWSSREMRENCARQFFSATRSN